MSLWKKLGEILGNDTADAPDGEKQLAEMADDAPQPEAQTTYVRAVIKSAKRDLDPVTLQGWSRVTFTCEDGTEMKMCFPGSNGVHLISGEAGLLEHSDGAFVSFEKDSGQIVAALYHIPADTEEA